MDSLNMKHSINIISFDCLGFCELCDIISCESFTCMLWKAWDAQPLCVPCDPTHPNPPTPMRSLLPLIDNSDGGHHPPPLLSH